MGCKKKYLIILPVLIIVFLGLFFVLSANKADDEAEIKEITESYLKNCAYNMYMYTDNDLESMTVMSLPDEAVKKTADNILLNGSKVTYSDLEQNIDFILKKCDYWRTIRAEQDILRNNFEVSYSFDSVNIDGNNASAAVSESISFYYDGVDTPSGIGTNYNVSLTKTGGQWYIIDVTSDDPLDSWFRDAGFGSGVD